MTSISTPQDAVSPGDEMQCLADVAAIGRLKAQYCRFIDTKQWDRLGGLFAAGTRFEGFGSAPSGADAATFVKGVSSRLRNVVSIHHCHMPEIVLVGRDRARGLWAMMDYLEWPVGESPKEAEGARGFCGYGHYEEEYVRDAGQWRFSFLRLTRLRIDALAHDHPALRPVAFLHDPLWLERGRVE